MGLRGTRKTNKETQQQQIRETRQRKGTKRNNEGGQQVNAKTLPKRSTPNVRTLSKRERKA
eukprot:7382495-Lingulodinium_polyedra.AAC.1